MLLYITAKSVILLEKNLFFVIIFDFTIYFTYYGCVCVSTIFQNLQILDIKTNVKLKKTILFARSVPFSISITIWIVSKMC